MAIGTTNISMHDISVELKYASLGTNNSMMNMLYDSSQLSYSIHGGSYHNLAMQLGSLAETFQIAIEKQYTIGTNLDLSGWAGYAHNAPVQLAYIINNGSGEDVDVMLYIGDNNNPGSGTRFFSGTIPANNGGNITANPANTGVAAYTNFSSTGYWISGNMQMVISGPPTFTPVNMNVTAAVDLDNVGTGKARYNYTANGSPGGAWGLNPFIGGSAFNDVLVSGVNGSAFPINGISWNKRTSITIDIS